MHFMLKSCTDAHNIQNFFMLRYICSISTYNGLLFLQLQTLPTTTTTRFFEVSFSWSSSIQTNTKKVCFVAYSCNSVRKCTFMLLFACLSVDHVQGQVVYVGNLRFFSFFFVYLRLSMLCALYIFQHCLIIITCTRVLQLFMQWKNIVWLCAMH